MSFTSADQRSDPSAIGATYGQSLLHSAATLGCARLAAPVGGAAGSIYTQADRFDLCLKNEGNVAHAADAKGFKLRCPAHDLLIECSIWRTDNARSQRLAPPIDLMRQKQTVVARKLRAPHRRIGGHNLHQHPPCARF